MTEIQQGTGTYKALYGDKPIQKSISQAIQVFGDYRRMADNFILDQPLYYDDAQVWWAWNKEQFKWELTNEIDILNIIDEQLNIFNSTKAGIKAEIIEALKRVSRLNKPLDIKPTWIQFKDKIIDIATSQEIKPTPEFFVTNPIPWEIGEDSETPTIDKLFIDWVGVDYSPLLYEIIAYSMIPSYPVHRIFCFLGAGLNGKSCYLELVRRMIGIDNITGAELDNLLNNRFGVTKLHKKLACFIGETNFNEMSKTSMLKQLSGGDLISFEYKGKNPFDDYNYAKLLIATNNLPTTTDKSIGFYRRWVVIDFPQQFTEKVDILSTIPEQEYRNLACKCVALLNKIWKDREFTNEGTIEERTKRFEDRSNPLKKFLEECTDTDWDCFIFKYDFKQKFWDWCKSNNFRKVSETFINRELNKNYSEGRKVAEWHTKEGNKPTLRTWEGLKWK